MSLAIDTNADRQLPEALHAELTKLLSDRFTTAPAVREHHGEGEAYHPSAPPDGVAYTNSTEEVSAIVKACAALDGHNPGPAWRRRGLAAPPPGAMAQCARMFWP